jgi:hypothetical protein
VFDYEELGQEFYIILEGEVELFFPAKSVIKLNENNSEEFNQSIAKMETNHQEFVTDHYNCNICHMIHSIGILVFCI